MQRPERKRPWLPSVDLMRNNIRTLTGLLLTGVLAVLVVAGMQWFSNPYRFPINVVEVKGDYRYIDRQQLQSALEAHAGGGFFTVDVAAIRAAAEQLPWVYKAKVQRIWPDKLRLVIEEQQPVAHWGDVALLNRFGEIFVPQNTAGLPALPYMAGPDGYERKVLEIYQQASRVLAPLGLQVNRVAMDERRALSLVLDGGVQLELGRSDAWLRLQRFVQAYPGVFEGQLQRLQRVDLRYSNGFSVYWQQVESGNVTEKQG